MTMKVAFATPEPLKPCPFCGGKPALFQSYPYTTGHGESGDDVGVKCATCRATIVFGDYAELLVRERCAEAVAAWNRRTP